MKPIGVLIVDDDEQSQTALRYILDSEGWKLQVVPQAHDALGLLASGEWTLAIVNVALVGLDGPVFGTLKELAQARAIEADRTRVRVLFLVPSAAGEEAQALLEQERLPYTLKPLHLHDFLEKVSDLLLEAQVISQPIRRVRHEYTGRGRQQKQRRSGGEPRKAMFASRDDYMMTEEEIAEFEKQEEEERAKKKKKKKEPYP